MSFSFYSCWFVPFIAIGFSFLVKTYMAFCEPPNKSSWGLLNVLHSQLTLKSYHSALARVLLELSRLHQPKGAVEMASGTTRNLEPYEWSLYLSQGFCPQWRFYTSHQWTKSPLPYTSGKPKLFLYCYTYALFPYTQIWVWIQGSLLTMMCR